MGVGGLVEKETLDDSGLGVVRAVVKEVLDGSGLNVKGLVKIWQLGDAGILTLRLILPVIRKVSPKNCKKWATQGDRNTAAVVVTPRGYKHKTERVWAQIVIFNDKKNLMTNSKGGKSTARRSWVKEKIKRKSESDNELGESVKECRRAL